MKFTFPMSLSRVEVSLRNSDFKNLFKCLKSYFLISQTKVKFQKKLGIFLTVYLALTSLLGAQNLCLNGTRIFHSHKFYHPNMNSKAKQSIGQRSREAGCSYQHEGCFHPIRIVSIKDKTCNTINIYLFIFFSSIITIVNSCLIKTSTEKEEDGPHLGSQQINRQKNCFSGFTSLTYLSEISVI